MILLMSLTLIGCVPDQEGADAYADAYSAEVDEVVEHPSDADDGWEDEEAATTVRLSPGEYDVVSLSDTIDPDQRFAALEEVKRIRPDVVHFVVREENHDQYVIAVPHVEEDDARVWMDLVPIAGHAPFQASEEGSGVAPPAAAPYVCNWLYRYPGYWGSVFKICGTAGTGSHGYSNLAVYGFDNLGSSYYCDYTSNGVMLYDSTSYRTKLAELSWDVSNFPSSYDNKTTSMWGYY